MRRCPPNSRPPRRGVTLLEMLVAVALLILMMTVVTSIFQAATGAITVAKTYQELDGSLRQLDSVLRQDLLGATADTGDGPLTPPYDPDLNYGYFEVGENQFADLQGEDSDDYVRFTARAPEGQPFTGRMWLGPILLPNGAANAPVMIQSQYAEVIYFLRNGNLYRRVFLVAPERQQAVQVNATGAAYHWQFPATAFGGTTVSWQGMNDLSARPSTIPGLPPVLNTLGDLTNRENRAFYPRFSNDYLTFAGGMWSLGPDGKFDDYNNDSVADWWPTLYPSAFATGLIPNPYGAMPGPDFTRQPNSSSNSDNPDLMSFPYTFAGAYSQADPSSASFGPIHGMGNPASGGNPADTGDPMVLGALKTNPYPTPYGYAYANGAAVLQSTVTVYQPNHNPIPAGDTLSTPDSPAAHPTALQTWWGFPTWKETMAGGTANTATPAAWADPVLTLYHSLSLYSGQAPGLSWSNRSSYLLPPLTDPTLDLQQYNDAAGTTTFATPTAVFRDDIIMQGVRSFDVKVYDNMVPGYVDLGYSNFVAGAPSATVGAGLLQTMGHEGRIPPLSADYRSYPNYPAQQIADDTAGINRLRRVWDTWSTRYSNAPATALVGGIVQGPPFTLPVYPSFPPPYPVPLRGLQIQIRVADPRNEHVKVLTIRHSFSS